MVATTAECSALPTASSSSPKLPNPHLIVHDVPGTTRPRKVSAPVIPRHTDGEAWGSNFWVTLVDPQTQTSFFACPATGEVSWDPPVGHFVLPPSEEGEWWELRDESRGLPYYYQTKTGETVWERPEAFVIPLGIIQNTALARRLSQTRFPRCLPGTQSNFVIASSATNDNQLYDQGSSTELRLHQNDKKKNISFTKLHAQQLTPIPGSEISAPPSPSPMYQLLSGDNDPESALSLAATEQKPGKVEAKDCTARNDFTSRTHVKSSPYLPHSLPAQQSLNAAMERFASTTSANDNGSQKSLVNCATSCSSSAEVRLPSTGVDPITCPHQGRIPRRRLSPQQGDLNPSRLIYAPTVSGKVISSPIPNPDATLEMSPVKDRAHDKPILVHTRLNNLMQRIPTTTLISSLATGDYRTLPLDLATDIQQFSESEFARQYFSTHRTGFIFKRKIPVSQMMTWQKTPLASPLLTLNRSLSKEAIKSFKIIQTVMGDREGEKPTVKSQTELVATFTASNVSTSSLSGSSVIMLEEERWLLAEGLAHGELRDEVYCQLMKQLTGNPNTESVFKGWQLLCILLITFPPSKNFETYLSSFIQQHSNQQEGRVDIMAKYCLRRLSYISRKGPRGKPPSVAELEAASDAAFHPSTFGESLDAILRLQERKYPQQKVPIILPFLANGILALGGPKSEGIFRVPGDSESVSELKLRIDQGYYTTDGVNDPHILASLLKLWLRELCDPLIPDEMYNECITNAQDAEACVRIVERLPTINRRVVLFVISFLQLFLEERVQSVTKMTPANLALVMAPNLLRCSSDSVTVVFTNAQYEQIFVYNLLLNLECEHVDINYVPVHGLGAIDPTPKFSKSRCRYHQPC